MNSENVGPAGPVDDEQRDARAYRLMQAQRIVDEFQATKELETPSADVRNEPSETEEIVAEIVRDIAVGALHLKSAGIGLRRLRDERRYLETQTTFEAFCADRIGITYRHANRLIVVAEVNEALGPAGPVQSERHARELASLLDDPPRLVAAYASAVESAPEKKPTAANVKTAVRAVMPPPDEDRGDEIPETERSSVSRARRVKCRACLGTGSFESADARIEIAKNIVTRARAVASKSWLALPLRPTKSRLDRMLHDIVRDTVRTVLGIADDEIAEASGDGE